MQQMVRRITNEILGVKGLSYHNRQLERRKYYIQLVKTQSEKSKLPEAHENTSGKLWKLIQK